jgi:hypothetical protein
MAGTLFSRAYWGWGNARRELIKAFDLAEKARGYERKAHGLDIREAR